MIYHSFADKQLSALGMGCMRLPVIDGDGAKIDMEATKTMVAYAMAEGINYFDTAWGYHNGMSEPVMGEILSAYPRESFYLASKFPGYDLSTFERKEEIFEKQLSRCRVDYFDFYLFHNVCEKNIDYFLDPKLGLYDYLMAQKKSGRIRHLGFSAHANYDNLKRFLAAYGADMEFCQLQINWLDWDFQKAKDKVALVSSYGIPIWVMEPVRGGSLVNLHKSYVARLNALRPGVTNAEWAFRFIQSLPQVKMTLSGMSNFDQLKENIETFATHQPTTAEENEVLFDIGATMTGKKTLPCTACRYCTEYCPRGLDIPHLMSLYNEHIYSGGGFLAPMGLEAMDEDRHPSACIGCRACEAVCPQEIEISRMMADFAKKMKK